MRTTIRFYLRVAQALQDTVINKRQIGQFLDLYQGVRIYRDGFWVKPYGQPGEEGDWLGLNARRVASPGGVKSGGYRIAGNQLVGSIYVGREANPALHDKTNREGLVENEAFSDVKRYILFLIQHLERYRVQQVKGPGEDSGGRVGDALSETKATVQQVRHSLQAVLADAPKAESLFPAVDGERLQLAMEGLERIGERIALAEEEYAAEQSERQLLMGLATTGIAMVAFGHETIHPITSILNRAAMIRTRAAKCVEPLREDIYKQVDEVVKAAEQTQVWGQYALDSVRRDRRTRRLLDVNGIVQSICRTFAVFLGQKRIHVEVELSPDLPSIRAFQMDLEAILINLLTNSVEALRHTPLSQRLIRIRTGNAIANKNQLEIRFADSGRGIPEALLDQIFNPMFSTRVDAEQKPVGTGMGLTIVRSLLENYEGSIAAEGSSDIGGAEFTIAIPTSGGSR